MIRVNRGQKENLPTLWPGEPGMCLDTGEFYVGGNNGNQRISGPWVTPEAYGAKGNGVHDDTAAINAAITAALAAGHGRVVFGAANYRVNSAVKVNYSDVANPVTLEGSSATKTRITGYGAINVIEVGNGSNAPQYGTIRNLRFVAGDASVLRCMYLRGCHNYDFYNVSTDGGLTAGVEIDGCYIQNWYGGEIEASNGHGIYISGTTLGVSTALKFWGTRLYGNVGWGLHDLGGAGRDFNFTVEQNDSGGIYLNAVRGFVFSGGYFEDNADYDVYISSACAGGAVDGGYYFANGGNHHFILLNECENITIKSPYMIAEDGMSGYVGVYVGAYTSGVAILPFSFKMYNPGTTGTAVAGPNAETDSVLINMQTDATVIRGATAITDLAGLMTDDDASFKTVKLSELTAGVIPYAGYGGVNLVSNGDFETVTTGWVPTDCSLSISSGGGQSGNCLVMTMTGGLDQFATAQVDGLVSGETYIFSGWVKSGTSGDTAYGMASDSTLGGEWSLHSGTSSDTWAQVLWSVLAASSSYVFYLYKENTAAGTMLFDSVSVMRVPELADSPLSTDGTDVICSGHIEASYLQGGDGVVKNVVSVSGTTAVSGTISNHDLSLWTNTTERMRISAAGMTKIGDASNYSSFAADGILTMAGTARTINEIWIDAGGIKAPVVKPAEQVDHGIGIAWEFSDATDDTIVFNMRIPLKMDRTVAPTIVIGWCSAATEKVGLWQLEYLYTAAGEDTTAAAQGTLPETGTTPAQAQGLVATIFDGIDAPGATDLCFHGRLKRLGADASDTLEDTALLLGLCMSFTTDKLGTAL